MQPTTEPRTKRCRFCNEEILAAAQKCKHCGEFLSPIARRAAGLKPAASSAQTAGVKIPMAEAFISLFFFLPLGIAALIFASQAQAKLMAGDVIGATTAATTAKTLAGISLIIGLIFAAL